MCTQFVRLEFDGNIKLLLFQQHSHICMCSGFAHLNSVRISPVCVLIIFVLFTFLMRETDVF